MKRLMSWFLALCCSVSCAACIRWRTPYVYEIPENFRGWVRVDFDAQGCPALGVGQRAIRVPLNGRLCTSSKIEEGVGRDEFYLVGRVRKRIYEDAPADTRLVWGRSFGVERSSAGFSKSFMTLFVGSRQEYEAKVDERPWAEGPERRD